MLYSLFANTGCTICGSSYHSRSQCPMKEGVEGDRRSFISASRRSSSTASEKRPEEGCREGFGHSRGNSPRAGEEYLSRLVQASEASAKESKQLKQSLVGDLKHILEELTERQIAANATSSNQIADRIVAGAKAEIDQEAVRAKEALREQVATLVVSGAEKILRREINAQAHADILAAIERGAE